jgi:hypothetical protein
LLGIDGIDEQAPLDAELYQRTARNLDPDRYSRDVALSTLEQPLHERLQPGRGVIHRETRTNVAQSVHDADVMGICGPINSNKPLR